MSCTGHTLMTFTRSRGKRSFGLEVFYFLTDEMVERLIMMEDKRATMKGMMKDSKVRPEGERGASVNQFVGSITKVELQVKNKKKVELKYFCTHSFC